MAYVEILDQGVGGTSPWAVSGGVTILNLPIIQGVTGTVSIAQLPAAAALSDQSANPTTTQIGANLSIWSGVSQSWNRALDISSANGLSFPGSGLLGVGLAVFDTGSVQYKRANSVASAIAGGLDGTHVLAVGNVVYAGSNQYFSQKGFADGTAVVSGGVVVSNFPATQSVTQGAGNAASSPWAVSGTLSVITASTPTRTSVSGSTTSGTILVANPSRLIATFYNDSTSALYLAFGGVGMSTTNFTTKLSSGQFYELPSNPIYTGVITGVWDTASGSVRVTEVTA